MRDVLVCTWGEMVALWGELVNNGGGKLWANWLGRNLKEEKRPVTATITLLV